MSLIRGPGINGIEAAKLIRAKSPKSAIIFLTQRTDADIRDAALVMSEAYVPKTNAVIDLVNVVSAAWIISIGVTSHLHSSDRKKSEQMTQADVNADFNN
jgi:DNA-binding NarL/FixJ family response regulator